MVTVKVGKRRSKRNTNIRRRRSCRSTRKNHYTSTKSRKRMCGGNYSTDITKHSFQGFNYMNANKTVVSYPGQVMSLAQYKKKLADDDMDGFNPTA